MNKKYIYAMWYHGEDHDPEASWDNDDAEWFNTCAEAIDAAQELIDAGTPGEDIVVMKFDREYQNCMWDDYMRFDNEGYHWWGEWPENFFRPVDYDEGDYDDEEEEEED